MNGATATAISARLAYVFRAVPAVCLLLSLTIHAYVTHYLYNDQNRRRTIQLYSVLFAELVRRPPPASSLSLLSGRDRERPSISLLNLPMPFRIALRSTGYLVDYAADQSLAL
jgi:hypothetical protein